MIRLHHICAVAALILTSDALRAADFDLQTTPSRPSADFSGVGLGVDAGVGLGSAGEGNASGAIGGAHIGYNFQASRLVGGAEADFLTSGIKSGGLTPTSFQQNFLSSTRVKAGWAFGDLLAYGTVGWAYSTSKLTDQSGSSNKSIKGWGGRRIRGDAQRLPAGGISALRLRRADLCDAAERQDPQHDHESAARRRERAFLIWPGSPTSLCETSV